ncbi:hypothetical protein BGZ76_004694 [Entomortierella beljakovae]|nr:hypothetical protein BGZ76_004694 [Entomortierella beljakovae]
MSNFYNPPGASSNLNGFNPPSPFEGSSFDSPYYQQGSSLEYGVEFEEEDLSTLDVTKEVLKYGIIKYLKGGLGAPSETCHTLLEVQYMPNIETVKSNQDEKDISSAAEEERRDEEFRRAQETAEEEEFFESGSGSGGYYSSNKYNTNHFPAPRSSANKLDPTSAVFKESKDSDQSGYLIRTDVYDDDTRPAHQLPPVQGGLWSVNKALVFHPTEGWTSPWKGHNAGWLYEFIHFFAQPAVETSLNDSFSLYDDSVPLVELQNPFPNLTTTIASHLVVGLVLSPLELVRTRLIVQSSDPRQRKYTGIFNCISTIIYEEGFTALWGGVNLLPTLICHTLAPLVANTIPLVIVRALDISPEESPFAALTAEFCLEILGVLIRTPFEIARKRLQIQIQAKIPGKRYETVVETRKRPYAGLSDCISRIIKEEGGQRRKLRSKKKNDDDGSDNDVIEKAPWYGTWQVRGLYTTLGLQLSDIMLGSAIGVVGLVAGLEIDIQDH